MVLKVSVLFLFVAFVVKKITFKSAACNYKFYLCTNVSMGVGLTTPPRLKNILTKSEEAETGQTAKDDIAKD